MSMRFRNLKNILKLMKCNTQSIYKYSSAEKEHINSFKTINVNEKNFCFSKAWNENDKDVLLQDMLIYDNFITSSEEELLLKEVEPYLQRLHYEFDHWDDAIHGYRETERLHWNETNIKVLNKVRDLAFPPGTSQLAHVHVLDLAKKGEIKPHIDATRFCGNIIAGLSLLSDSVMRLVHDKQKQLTVDIFLKRYSLYIMKDTARYEYTHEILGDKNSKFYDKHIQRDRRISVICRNEPMKIK